MLAKQTVENKKYIVGCPGLATQAGSNGNYQFTVCGIKCVTDGTDNVNEACRR